MSFTIKENESIALVGLNGAGKSTLVSLLMGLLKPTNGEILINGIPSSAFDSQVYMRLFSPIFQFGATFADTIENNITLTNTSDLSVDSAIDQAGLTKDIQALPEGKHTSLTQYLDDKGVSLSGGQSQKLMLARALYKNGQVLVLDEPTAALDALAESNLYQQYHELTRGKIAIFISHRLASTQFADTVFFIKDGRLVDTGTHSELMQMNEEYANLYNVQSQYYQEEDDSND
ncbi:ATP-binding cassette domain-containing protein [Levilactobacillus cerevisiae]|uniref:ATP-binding cassette domain-containing protein n=1 Tax=Levilactobacillus cerevisiae TaxID=1704076 RepID=UPI0013DDD324|nr:ABC transporter ATP-binding protein [Levilactobacillus cerevisiae]